LPFFATVPPSLIPGMTKFRFSPVSNCERFSPSPISSCLPSCHRPPLMSHVEVRQPMASSRPPWWRAFIWFPCLLLLLPSFLFLFRNFSFPFWEVSRIFCRQFRFRTCRNRTTPLFCLPRKQLFLGMLYSCSSVAVSNPFPSLNFFPLHLHWRTFI